ncbi:MAG TPA: ribonuclease Z [Acidimicrobiales bacterium]|nr:ribonuclease Z [Acidimicrobiales bacterium]
MAARELVVLGTASQAPTRYRNHNGYLLRWDGEGVLFDPGEGTQRQLVLAGVASSAITRICITHFHGDHCLGLPGVLARLELDRRPSPVDVYFPAAGRIYFDRLRLCTYAERRVPVRAHPVAAAATVAEAPPFRLQARPLDHRTATVGWRLEEPDGVRMLADRLDASGVAGPLVGRLMAEGSVTVGGRTVHLDDVSEPRRGQSVAFVMDTRWCDAAVALATGVDLLVCEATFLSSAGEDELADVSGHLTAAQAARLAVAAGAHHLVLTHFSQRHPDEQAFLDEAQPIFPETTAAHDLAVIPLPPRRAAGATAAR